MVGAEGAGRRLAVERARVAQQLPPVGELVGFCHVRTSSRTKWRDLEEAVRGSPAVGRCRWAVTGPGR